MRFERVKKMTPAAQAEGGRDSCVHGEIQRTR